MIAALLAILAAAVDSTAGAPAAIAPAATERIAIVASSDVATGQAALRYAGRDAGRMAAVLRELGGFTTTRELRNPTPEELRRALEAIEDLAARRPGLEFVFYYSGHADPHGLLLGERRFSYQELRQRLEQSRAVVRIAVLDACFAGAAIRAKGGVPSPGFSLEAFRPQDLRGAVIVSASTASEVAQESSVIEGSYFTHHLLSALRGAGDQDGNGVVTLAEAYRYAYVRTTSATLPSVWGTQHPSYEYRLAGAGELVLTHVTTLGRSAVVLPEGTGITYFVESHARELIAEVAPLDRRRVRVALRPGRYRVLAQETGRTFAAEVRVPESGDAVIERSALREVPAELAFAKGGAHRRNDLYVGVAMSGLGPGVFGASGEIGAAYMRRGLRWSRGVVAAYGRADNTLPGVAFTLDRARLTAETFRRFDFGSFDLQAGGGLGAALVHERLIQTSPAGGKMVQAEGTVVVPTGALSLALEVPILPWLPLRLAWGGAFDLLRVDGRTRLVSELRASVAAGVRF